jgi:hypothetical protein
MKVSIGVKAACSRGIQSTTVLFVMKIESPVEKAYQWYMASMKAAENVAELFYQKIMAAAMKWRNQ